MTKGSIKHGNSNSWLITGGCGFIGTSLISHLLKEFPSSRIRVLDNLSVGTHNDIDRVCDFKEHALGDINSSSLNSSQVELAVGDIRDHKTCLRCCDGIDYVIHLAANTGVAPSVQDPRSDMETNVTGTFNMLEGARKNSVARFIFASSGAPIGETEPPIHEEKAPRPVSPYGASKLSGEGYCSAYYRTYGLKTISLRFGNVYGPLSDHKNSVVAKFFKRALAGEPLEIFGDGNQTRDFIYIDDLIIAIILAATGTFSDTSLDSNEDLPWGEVFQIATFKETSVNEIAQTVKMLVEEKKNHTVKLKHSANRTGDVRRNCSNIEKAKQILGFIPSYDIQKGLRSTFSYFDGLN
jgi:UDP-glucose 4-epimerase